MIINDLVFYLQYSSCSFQLKDEWRAGELLHIITFCKDVYRRCVTSITDTCWYTYSNEIFSVYIWGDNLCYLLWANLHSGTCKQTAADGSWRASIEMLKQLAFVGVYWGATQNGKQCTSYCSKAVDDIWVKADYGIR